MNQRLLIATLCCLLCSRAQANAQRKPYVGIKAEPLVRFDFDCTEPSPYSETRLDHLIIPILKKYGDVGVKWGNRAFAYDLNGNKSKEYFVPIVCGATGNCLWGIFAANPARLLGIVEGETIYVHKRAGRWSRLTVATHQNASDSLLKTYRFRNGHYHVFGDKYETSAYRYDFPKSLLSVQPRCNTFDEPPKVHR